MTTILPDNPNPRANVGFICYYPLQYYVYKNIYRHLENAEFIVDDSYRKVGFELPPEYHESLFRFFSKEGVYWRKLSFKDAQETRSEFFKKYAVLVNTIPEAEMFQPYIRDKRLVRVMYGYAKDPWNFGPWSAHFDLVLTYGPYAQKHLEAYGNAVAVGNPKFDDWFSSTEPTPYVRGNTVLYAPTWGTLSSLPRLSTAINALSSSYRFVVKVHHMTGFLNPGQVEPYRSNPNITVVDDTADLLPLLRDSVAVLSDNSGAVFDAILADKPIGLIQTESMGLIDVPAESIMQREEGKLIGVATSASSFEQHVRKAGKEVGPILDLTRTIGQATPEDLKELIEQARADADPFRRRRTEYREMGFVHLDGTAGKRAADAILHLLHQPKPEKNFLSQSMTAYVREILANAPMDAAAERQIRENFRTALKAMPFLERLRTVYDLFFQ